MARILCIDDDQDIRDSLTTILESKNHEVQTAVNGEEGLKKAPAFNPDMIILDVMMTDSTEGFHVAYNFRKDEELKYTPILMLTSINQDSSVKFDPDTDGQFLPVDDFIEKPISPQKLIEVTDKLLALSKDEINVQGQKSIYD